MDDDPEVCWVFEHILSGAGFVCEAVHTGHEAIRLIHHQPFRMAFLDAQLIELKGLDLARGLRELDPSLPIIMVSGYFYAEDALIREAIESGLISAFISKPFEHHEILRVIELHATR